MSSEVRAQTPDRDTPGHGSEVEPYRSEFRVRRNRGEDGKLPIGRHDMIEGWIY